MSIRKPAAKKLVRQLLELRLYRTAPLSEEFLDAMADIVMAHVALDEQHARTEELTKDKGK